MFKPLIFSLTLIVVLSGCSKKDDAASNNVQTAPANTEDSSKDAGGKTANATAVQGPARSEPQSEGTAKEAATPTEAQPKKHKKHVTKDSSKGTRSVMRHRWSEFQAMVDRCDTTTGAATDQCVKGAKDAYRSANFKCDALAAPERANCQQFAERWNNAVTNAPPPAGAVTHGKEPTTTALPPPGDPGPAERNRDSTKQH